MRTIQTLSVAATMSFFAVIAIATEESGDPRQLVEIPKNIEAKMLTNMRDHIGAFDDIVNAITAGDYEKAEDVAEFRLGWSSLVRQDDSSVAKHWAEPMQKMADKMYRAASNFVIVSQNASTEESPESYRKVLGALGELTSACKACHMVYRVR